MTEPEDYVFKSKFEYYAENWETTEDLNEAKRFTYSESRKFIRLFEMSRHNEIRCMSLDEIFILEILDK